MISKFIRFVVIVLSLLAFSLLAMEAFFVVTNSNRTEFISEGEAQNMSSGLYSAYIHSENLDYRKIKAKGGLFIDFDFKSILVFRFHEIRDSKS